MPFVTGNIYSLKPGQLKFIRRSGRLRNMIGMIRRLESGVNVFGEDKRVADLIRLSTFIVLNVTRTNDSEHHVNLNLAAGSTFVC